MSTSLTPDVCCTWINTCYKGLYVQRNLSGPFPPIEQWMLWVQHHKHEHVENVQTCRSFEHMHAVVFEFPPASSLCAKLTERCLYWMQRSNWLIWLWIRKKTVHFFSKNTWPLKCHVRWYQYGVNRTFIHLHHLSVMTDVQVQSCN